MVATVDNNAISQNVLNSVNGNRESETSKIQETEDRFLKLLVEQMKNQDPLNPMDNAAVTSQMAQLSTVTGIDKLNATMASMIDSVHASQSYQAANMIGHDVLVEGNQITNTGEGGYFGVELATSADKVNIEIKDAAGTTIRNVALGPNDPGVAAVEWDGLTDDGDQAAEGQYTFAATSTIGETTNAATALTFANVKSVSNDAKGVQLNLSNQTSVSTTDVREIF